jgi:DNA polymerase-3 subunit delta
MRGMAARPGSVPVTLVLGEEELLAERAVADAVAAARERLGAGTSVEEVRAGGLPDGFAMGLATASLFGGGRVVVVQEAEGLDGPARDAVLARALIHISEPTRPRLISYSVEFL